MKLVKVSEHRIVDAETGTVWSFEPGGYIAQQFPCAGPIYPKLYLDNRAMLANDEAEVMWDWLSHNVDTLRTVTHNPDVVLHVLGEE